MAKAKKFKSDAFAAIHESAAALHKVGAINKATLRGFDTSCLAPLPEMIGPDRIRQIRQNAHVSQPVFALYLNTSESTVQQWESGKKHPSGAALKLLTVVEKHGLEVLA